MGEETFKDGDVMGKSTLYRAASIVVAIFLLNTAQAQPFSLSRFGSFLDVEEKLSSDESTKVELERVQKLAPSKSAALNQEALAEAKQYAEVYSSWPTQIAQLEAIQPEVTKKKVIDSAAQLTKAVATCIKKTIGEQMLVLNRQFAPFQSFRLRGFVSRSSDQGSGLTEAEEAAVNETFRILELDSDRICAEFKDPANATNLSGQLEQSADLLKKVHSKALADLKMRAPRAKQLAEAWSKYRDQLLRSIEDQSAPASKVADQLGYIIAIFCAFGLLMFFAVRIFSQEVQLELVASGQVVQFATVMILLIVVCVLGMSKFLTENTLGTLLGGIGGYVLSQGVGRAATRALSREIAAQDKGRG